MCVKLVYANGLLLLGDEVSRDGIGDYYWDYEGNLVLRRSLNPVNDVVQVVRILPSGGSEIEHLTSWLEAEEEMN